MAKAEAVDNAPAHEFLKYVNTTGSPYHSVSSLKALLLAKGFRELDERSGWDVAPGGNYFVIRNHSAIAAFHIGSEFVTGHGGIDIIAGHTDSPCLRLRPNTTVEKEGYLQIGVECYGGGLWHTWFDRGLGLAGKVMVRRKAPQSTQERLEIHFVRIDRSVCILPNLAIHLRTAEERDAFKVHRENHLMPILCSKVREQLVEPPPDKNDKKNNDKTGKNGRHHAPLLSLLAGELGCQPEEIVDLDLCLMDATPSRLCGVYDEFLESPRLDNLVSSWAAIKALMDLCEGCHSHADPACHQDIWVAVAFDHEEIGSTTWAGADSAAMETWIVRILRGLKMEDRLAEVIARSFLMSADMAHGVHPNYADKHQPQHKPLLQKGVVLKENINQRYTTHALTSAIFREICRCGNVPMQDFVVKNDSPCGSTVGPMLSAKLGIRAIDVGIPQWAMHSCRETCGADDITHYLNLFKAFFGYFRAIDNGIVAVNS
ncbi:unnamed protein product [Vitrella brassicaformis CCMP3155]|uniref:aspartyl aminopeptidase n=1 Tax=Vitrella brassicaformis (strain CCMP3155) TaxID=1169540 RepID=A0A0G4EKE3_VITBC|nr:unnamed protein product [Vitrella brassicaformis CCMP3155]|eukprot:CEL97258.1 unnamed protein product [Vitrella brassicaformis CCMP3155]